MRNKKIFRTMLALCAALVLTCGFSVTAYAGGGDSEGEEIPTDDSGVITTPQPLTPEGNMELIDDIQGEAAEDKQFIVVQSRNGNYFYIVIDHAAEGENSVHFLNQVDEADLLAIIESEETEEAPAVCNCSDKCGVGHINTSCPVCSVNLKECVGKEAEPEPVEDEPEKESGGMGGLVIFLVVALLGGGGAFYYFKIIRRKQDAKGSDDLDDLDFDEYDEDDEQPDEEQEDEDV